MENIKIPTIINNDITEEDKNDYVLVDVDEDTIDLSNVIEQTQKLNVSGDING